MSAFVDHLTEHRQHWDLIDLREIREDSPNLPLFLSEMISRGTICECTESTICLHIPIDTSWEEYFSQVRGKFQSDIRRLTTKLGQIGQVHWFGTAPQTQRFGRIWWQ